MRCVGREKCMVMKRIRLHVRDAVGRIYSDYICTPLRRDDCLVENGKTDMMDMS